MLEVLNDLFIPVVSGFFGCAAISLVFNIRGKKVFYAALGGMLSSFVYLFLNYYTEKQAIAFFVAAVAVSIYAEVLARFHKVPTIVYSVVGLIPLVPGKGIYLTMEYGIRGELNAFGAVGLNTLISAGAIAMGVFFVTSIIRIYYKTKAVLAEDIFKDI